MYRNLLVEEIRPGRARTIDKCGRSLSDSGGAPVPIHWTTLTLDGPRSKGAICCGHANQLFCRKSPYGP